MEIGLSEPPSEFLDRQGGASACSFLNTTTSPVACDGFLLLSAKRASAVTKSMSLPLRVSGSGDQALPQRPDNWNLNVTPSRPIPSDRRAPAIDLSHSERRASCNSALMFTVVAVV